MSRSLHIDRRAFLKGLGGVAMALPVLDAMGAEVTNQIPRRFCALYTANGMSLPKSEHGINDWSWFPTAESNGEFVFGKSTEPLTPFRKQVSFMGGLYHPNGPKADPHICSDMWLTGAPLQNPKAGNVQLRRTRSDRRPANQAVLPAAFPRAVDRCRHRLPLAYRHDLLQPRRKADPRRKQPAPRLRPPVPKATARRSNRNMRSCSAASNWWTPWRRAPVLSMRNSARPTGNAWIST